MRRVVREHPYTADFVLAAILFGMSLGAAHGGGPNGDHEFVVTGPSLVVGALICAALVLRRRWPVPVLAFTAVGTAFAIVLTDARTPYSAIVAVAAYSVAVRTDRTLAWVVGISAGLLMLAVGIISTSGSWSNPRSLQFLAWVAVGIAVGDARRSRRAFVASIEERALRAERTREEEAGRQVAEERLRIARELHDIVAHHIALINVQAGVASHMLHTEPEAADVALGHVRTASRAVLEELGMLLGVLRQSGDTGVPTEPAPNLARLDSLVESFAQAGLHVELTTSGRVRHSSGAVDLAAYRIIQESLTNAHKHGDGTGASVCVHHLPNELQIVVSNHVFYDAKPGTHNGPKNGSHNGPKSGAEPSTGHGLLGMHERAVSVGGTLRASTQPDGDFRVDVVLPRPEAG
ncbi:MAG: Two-component system sensor kinase [Amycolatopsis sp.]|jgi:signal transduction histidine kinase|nr:Two-component system sensor kinase [Amycolatopsis sp.]